jgi:hypothetical protein
VVKHYAGDVVYTIDGFMDTNNDMLFRDLKIAMIKATNVVISSQFSEEELESKKRLVLTCVRCSLAAVICSGSDQVFVCAPIDSACYPLCVVFQASFIPICTPAYTTFLAQNTGFPPPAQRCRHH